MSFMMSSIKSALKSALPQFPWESVARRYHRTRRLPFVAARVLYGVARRTSPRMCWAASVDAPVGQMSEIQRRFAFYFPDWEVEFIPVPTSGKLPWSVLLNDRPVFKFGAGELTAMQTLTYRWRVFDVDYLRNPQDGWQWHEAIGCVTTSEDSIAIEARQRFAARVSELREAGLERCYLFGTGPSLQRAIERDWSDGYRVVCNTIVRDPELWQALDPHFVVAGDAIYHFGHTAFAKAFRRDLVGRLRESNALFVYPAFFHPFVAREMKDVSDRLVPIPFSGRMCIRSDLTREFRLPTLGNVLCMLLLPIGCTLSKRVFFFGFDGRAPADRLFWSNSERHTYPELMPELEAAHPAFFQHHVPKSDPTRYVRSVHGDQLEECLSEAESMGWRFVMMHQSWTPTLQKRFSQT